MTASRRARSGSSQAVAVIVAVRPIITTCFAFILVVLPLLLAWGAGGEMRRTLGTAVFAGMIGVPLGFLRGARPQPRAAGRRRSESPG